MKLLTAVSILTVWFITSVLLISASLLIYPKINSIRGLSFLIADSSRNILTSPTNPSGLENVLAAVKGGDARPVLVDRFLARYGSPMVGLGQEFVSAADKNGLDWRLLPALAFQESNLGKKIPRSSYNPFGWAIYEGKTSGAYFDNWEEGINIVATRIKDNYVSAGLSTPETIAARYTANSNPTWIFAVRSAMEEISSNEY